MNSKNYSTHGHVLNIKSSIFGILLNLEVQGTFYPTSRVVKYTTFNY